MNPLREKVKKYLMLRYPMCAICGEPATDLHEIVCPLRHKYDPDNSLLARRVYRKENCVLLCNRCNVMEANSIRDDLIRHNMCIYGVDAVVRLYRVIARHVKSASSWIPSSIEYWGEVVRILE
jgi:hypothetical protein